jgi:sugar/nucleoside kinase (ribokinase family)
MIKAAQFATTAAALSVAKKGVMNSIPYHDDVVKARDQGDGSSGSL